MKFRIEQEELKDALAFVSRAVTNRSTMPVLKGILMKVDEDGMLTMTASDNEFTIEKRLPVYESEPGETVVPAKIFGEVVRKLNGNYIEFILEENNCVNIVTESGDFRIITIESADFPKITDTVPTGRIGVDSEKFRRMVNETSFAASIDKSRGVIVGILIEAQGDSINMVALDGFRMAVASEKTGDQKNDDASIIVPSRILSDIGRMVSEYDSIGEKIEIMFDSHRAFIQSEDSRIVIRTIEGKYLDYERLLPADFSTNVTVVREDFINSVEMASLFAREGRNNLVKLRFAGNGILISSKSEVGDVREKIDCEIEGQEIEIGFNSKYLIEGLKAIDDERVIIKLESSIKPCIIKPEKNDDYKYLLLPVRIIN